MANEQIAIINGETGEMITREMTDAEQASRDAEVAAYLADEAVKTAALEKAETDKAALLAKLGITADEAKLLLS